MRDVEKRRAEKELEEKQARLKEVAEAQEKTAQAQQERAAAQERTEQALRETSRAQKRAQLALGAIATMIFLAGGALRWLYKTETSALQRQHANLLGELAIAQLADRNPDAALRFASKGTEDDLALGLKSDAPSTSSAVLAKFVSGLDWRLAFRAAELDVTSAAFSPDGTRIVTASRDKTARVWDAATAKEIAVLRGHEYRVWSAAFSPDGTRIVTASGDNTARVWDANFSTMPPNGSLRRSAITA